MLFLDYDNTTFNIIDPCSEKLRSIIATPILSFIESIISNDDIEHDYKIRNTYNYFKFLKTDSVMFDKLLARYLPNDPFPIDIDNILKNIDNEVIIDKKYKHNPIRNIEQQTNKYIKN